MTSGRILIFVSLLAIAAASKKTDERLLIVTVATERTDGYLRFERSAKVYGHELEVFGMGEVWKGGDVRTSAGGGQKVKLLREGLKKYKDDDKTIVLFSDSYDAIISAGPAEILEKYHEKFPNAKIVFTAEGFCWPDKTLAYDLLAPNLSSKSIKKEMTKTICSKVDYPLVKFGKRYLNSGGFMGPASQVYALLMENTDIQDKDDDQLYYTKLYLNKDLREKYSIELDTVATMFQALNGVAEEIVLDFPTDEEKGVRIRNIAYGTSAAVVHGNGASKNFLNWLGNYIGKYYNATANCAGCNPDTKTIKETEEDKVPTVTLAIFIEKPTYFIDHFLNRLKEIKYPKRSLDLIVHNAVDKHADALKNFLEETSFLFKAVRVLESGDFLDEKEARTKAVEYCLANDCDYLFVIDSEAQLTNEDVITRLIETGRPFVAPMLSRPGKLWTNFWGSLSEEGYYERSEDYVDIVQNKKWGVWNVPYVNNAYLIHRSRLENLKSAYTYNAKLDAEMSLAEFQRHHGYFMYVDNRLTDGHLMNNDDYDPKLTHPDLHQLFENRFDWEQKYIHQDYRSMLRPDVTIEQPCPDVFWFPIFSPTFCQHLIETMEAFGKWSSGTNTDERLVGGYENVPTRDIHMNQVGLERHWLHILNEFVNPVQEKVFAGYYNRPPQAVMNFVVRYRPDEQPSLRPHNDASTYTINVNLNRPGIDYQGGGARFIRYNCSVVELRHGWGLIHPGRLTHLHEGLPTTKGTRYIMVSFVDP